MDIQNAAKRLRYNKADISDRERIAGAGDESRMSDEQLKRRALYLCVQKNEKQSDSSLLYANIGLACLGIRRILKVSGFFLITI